MFHRREFFTILAISCILQAHCADKYTDEKRPYEFGFKIDGEQHRHEKKDENGLIMGEFGFITADGVYHVTVYATDENGNFKILSMKNIRVKPYPTGPERTNPERTGHSLPFPPSQNPPQTQGPVPQKPQGGVSGPSQAAPAKSCSSCSIPTTTTQKPVLTDIAVVSQDQPNTQFQGGQQYPQDRQQNNPAQNDYPQSNQGQNYPQGGFRQNYPQGDPGAGENYPQANVGATYPQQGAPGEVQSPGRTLQAPFGSTTGGERSPKQFTDYPQGTAGSINPGAQGEGAGQYGSGGNQGGSNQFGPAGPNSSGQFGPGVTGGNNGQFGPGATGGNNGQFGAGGANGGNSQFGPAGAKEPNKPTLISAQMQIVDKNTDIYQRKSGEKEGLPDGLTKNDMLQLLYTFNYTVGFHGHFEEGYTNGAKQGYYYVTGRNGVRTRVDYVADEKGFRPKITQEVLDLLSDDVPKPETEKDEKYGLKGYEFKWLYYPVESSSR